MAIILITNYYVVLTFGIHSKYICDNFYIFVKIINFKG